MMKISSQRLKDKKRLQVTDNEPGTSAGAGYMGEGGGACRASLFSSFARLRLRHVTVAGPGRGRRSERRDIGHVIRAAETRGGDTPWSPPSDVRTTSGPRASLPAVCRCHTLLILSGKDVWGQPRHRRQEDQ